MILTMKSKGSKWLLVLSVSIGMLQCGTNAEQETNESLDNNNNDNENKTKPTCGIYLAPSAIPGSGLGMYAGDAFYKKGETVTQGDTVIPILEQEWHTSRFRLDHSFLWDEYTWNGNVFPPMEYEEADDVEYVNVASPGVGAAANSYLSLVNVEDTYIKIGRSVAPDSPGTGASTPYYSREFFATRDIPPGAEIYADYGTNYFMSRPQTYGYIPMPRDFQRADKFIQRFQKRSFPESIREELWEIVTSTASIWETSRTLNAMPSEYSQIDHVMEIGGTGQKDFERSIKDIDWLAENGQCMDNIKPGNSTNPDAGRGAFANRFIPKDGLVAPAPLIHIPDTQALKMFEPMDNPKHPGKVIPDIHGASTYQLILNYCFGHHESTLVLCPYGLLTSFINHSSKSPNTRIVWSQTMRHPEWLEQPIPKWGDEYHTGFQIDFVALRDIEEDEEIFIDYGDAWKQAWDDHVKNYQPRAETYTPAYELNEMTDLEYRTIEDRPYENDGVQMWCRKYYLRKFKNDDTLCRVLKKTGDDKYLIRLEYHNSDDEDGTTTINRDIILWDIPSDAFYFADIPYTRDHYQFDAFRHAMMIPEDMFPDVWKNLRED